MNRITQVCTLALALGVAGCVNIPTGPGVMVLPNQGKPFEMFRAEQADCQGYAQQTVGIPASVSAQNSATQSATVGTVLGAAAGALLGSASGNAGAGAAIGAGTGLIFGSAAGASAYDQSGMTMQDRYDAAYLQCMYAKGNQIPMSAGFQTSAPSVYPAPGAPNAYPPPNAPPPAGTYGAPPPGTYPPPPPRY